MLSGKGGIELKKVWDKCCKGLIIAVCIPILVLFFGAMLLYLPMDYVLYKISRFGREVGERYTAWEGLTETVRLYGGIRRAGLPINYADGHFLYGNTMLLHDIGNISYREETGEWIIDEGAEEQETTLSAYAEEQLARDPTCEWAVLLIDRENIDSQDLPKAEQCDSILLYEVNGRNSAVKVLRRWIDAGAGE